MLRSYLRVGCAAACLLAAGCSNTGTTGVNAASPGAFASALAGTWTGKSEVKGGDLAKALNGLAGGPLTGSSSLTLNGDGTGFLKVADKPERPISWKQEGQKVILQLRALQPDAQEEKGGPWVGTLSDDDRSLTIDMEDVRVVLAKAK